MPRHQPFKPREIVAPQRWRHLFDAAPSRRPVELQETRPRQNPREAVEPYAKAVDYPAPRLRRGQRTTLPTPETFLGLRIRLALLRDPEYRPNMRVRLTCAQDAYRLVKGLESEVVENMLALVLDAKHRVLGVYEACRGQASSVAVSPVDLLRAVVAAGAVAFIAVHNHPSGDPEPSVEDRALTQHLKQAAKVLGVAFLDHIIIGEDSWVSLAERGEI